MKKVLSLLVAVLILMGLVGCSASKKVDQSGSTRPPAYKVPALSAEEAQAIALEHAGFTADQVTLLNTQYQVENNIPEYEVEFQQANQEYEYTIHADSGEILEIGKDSDSPTGAPEYQPKISKEAARDIAIKHAGVNGNDVQDLKIEFERDDGVPEYSVEFRVGAWELDYEIHADTGDILNYEKERS